MKVLILTDDAADDAEVVSFLGRRKIPFVAIDSASFVVEEIGLEEYALCLFIVEKGHASHLQSLRAIKEALSLSGQLGPPVVFMVKKNRASFEQSARIADIDIYLTSPVDENVLSSLLKLKSE